MRPETEYAGLNDITFCGYTGSEWLNVLNEREKYRKALTVVWQESHDMHTVEYVKAVLDE